MLENIKSSYIIQLVMSLIDQTKKFKIIKYNKNLQKKLELNLLTYKNYTQKYIIYEEKGKGKEYSGCDILCFEGEYKNGERNGKGKEFDYNGELEFEGEYLNGKRNGKGLEFDYGGEITFEGEYLNGKKWNGKKYGYETSYTSEWTGEEFYKNIFTAEYLNGKIWNAVGYLNIKEGKGHVIKYYKGGYPKIEFEGEYLNGERNGKGERIL